MLSLPTSSRASRARHYHKPGNQGVQKFAQCHVISNWEARDLNVDLCECRTSALICQDTLVHEGCPSSVVFFFLMSINWGLCEVSLS